MEQFLILIFVLLKFSEVPAPPTPFFQNPAYATGLTSAGTLDLLGLLATFPSKCPEAFDGWALNLDRGTLKPRW